MFFCFGLAIAFFATNFSIIAQAAATDCEYGPTEDETRCMTQAEWCQANPKSSFCSSSNSGVCAKNGDPCTLSTTGQAGTCNDKSGKMLCYASNSSGNVIMFTNPLNFYTVEGLLGTILSAVQKIIVTLALVFIVIGAVMITTSAGTPEMMERGKKAITMALVGLAIGIAAPSILKELAGVLGWGTTSNSTVNAALSLSAIALRVLNFLLGIAGTLTLIMLVIGAIMYLTSAGDQERIDKGKQIFKFSLIGVVIVLASLVIVKQLALFFVAG